jgi:hypothetical protein
MKALAIILLLIGAVLISRSELAYRHVPNCGPLTTSCKVTP